MRKNRVIQFSLVIMAVILFFFTYYYGQDKDGTSNFDSKTSVEQESKLKKNISNVINDVSYDGTDNRGTLFKLDAELAEIFHDKPTISNMKAVTAVVSLRNGRKINIKSDYAIYDRSTNNTNFMDNVKITVTENKITSDNLDLFMSKNLITIYNNVKYSGENGFLIADRVDIDILKNESNIFMFDRKNKVQVKYDN